MTRSMIDDDTEDVEIALVDNRKTNKPCKLCGYIDGRHSADCALVTWNCGLCGALLNRKTFSDHYSEHRALAVQT
jgi:hypothetical protein